MSVLGAGKVDRTQAADYTGQVGAEAVAVIALMAATPALDDRMRLLERLYEAAHPVVGGQAAETIACLPAPASDGGPEWRGWRRETHLPASLRGVVAALWRAWRVSRSARR